MVAGYLLGSGNLLGSLLSYLLSLFSQAAAPLESRMLTLGIKIVHLLLFLDFVAVSTFLVCFQHCSYH